MEAPIETPVSAPETTPETPTVEPQVPEATAPVTEPIPAEPSTPEVAPVENKEVTPENPPEPIPEFDETALEGILDEIAASVNGPKFTFKEDAKVDTPSTETVPTEPGKEGDPAITPEDKAILDELTEVAQVYSEENKNLTIEKQTLTAELESERTAKQEALELASKVDDIWKDVVSHIPILDQYAEAKLKGEAFELPPILREDVQKALQEHPIVGPLNRALIAGEALPISAFVKSLADYRRSTAPQMADARTSVPTKDEKPGVKPNKLGGLHGVKPVTAL